MKLKRKKQQKKNKLRQAGARGTEVSAKCFCFTFKLGFFPGNM